MNMGRQALASLLRKFRATEITVLLLYTVDYGLVKTHYLVKILKIILDLCVPIIVSSQKKYSV